MLLLSKIDPDYKSSFISYETKKLIKQKKLEQPWIPFKYLTLDYESPSIRS